MTKIERIRRGLNDSTTREVISIRAESRRFLKAAKLVGHRRSLRQFIDACTQELTSRRNWKAAWRGC